MSILIIHYAHYPLMLLPPFPPIFRLSQRVRIIVRHLADHLDKSPKDGAVPPVPLDKLLHPESAHHSSSTAAGLMSGQLQFGAFGGMHGGAGEWMEGHSNQGRPAAASEGDALFSREEAEQVIGRPQPSTCQASLRKHIEGGGGGCRAVELAFYSSTG